MEELLLDVPESCLLYGAVIPLYLDKTKGQSTAGTPGWNCPPKHVAAWAEGVRALCELYCLSSKPIKSAHVSIVRRVA